MEKLVVLLIPAIFAGALLRLLLIPMKLVFRLLLHAGCGLLCLWLLNGIARFTGILFPINPATVLIAGVLGLPGICLMASPELLT